MVEQQTWTLPTDVDDIMLAFPAGVVSNLMPPMDEIPSEFRNHSMSGWNRWQAEWFFNGLKELPVAKDGVDQHLAIRHLKAIQGSFEPKHEHKEAAVAYLASLWFVAPSA